MAPLKSLKEREALEGRSFELRMEYQHPNARTCLGLLLTDTIALQYTIKGDVNYVHRLAARHHNTGGVPGA
ncbi:MAG: hypothetical protein WBZ42_02890 [Halobacteriota archaeon]